MLTNYRTHANIATSQEAWLASVQNAAVDAESVVLSTNRIEQASLPESYDLHFREYGAKPLREAIDIGAAILKLDN